MMTVTSPSNFSISIAAAAFVFCVGGIAAATAQSMPDKENGRYALAPVADGVIRLDTRTGTVSNWPAAGRQ
jgi:hypothetical protein